MTPFNIDEKAAILQWLISAHGVAGIPRLRDGYDLTIEDLVELGADLDENGLPIPVETASLYVLGKISPVTLCKTIETTTEIHISGSDILRLNTGEPVELCSPVPEGYHLVPKVVFHSPSYPCGVDPYDPLPCEVKGIKFIED